jgi:2-polyprenyl-3-methyl-5-hydroxy-6-metoxy-1,4-benzoquinol methylase
LPNVGRERLSVLKEQGINPTISSSKTKLLAGVCDIDYYHGRQKRCQLTYRLCRRTEEVERALSCYSVKPLQTIIDIGTADGLMLASLRQKWGKLTFIGIDHCLNLLKSTSSNGVIKIQADALNLPLRGSFADVVIATATIEHVADPGKVVRECAKVLWSGGLIVLTTP